MTNVGPLFLWGPELLPMLPMPETGPEESRLYAMRNIKERQKNKLAIEIEMNNVSSVF